MNIVGWLWVVSYVGICRLSYQAIGDTLPTRWRWASSSASELSAWQPPHQIGHCVALSRQQHHWGMMCGGGGNKIGGRSAGGDDSYNRWVCTSIDHGGCHCPTATMGPHSQLLSIQQSANILCNRTTLLKLEKLSLIMFISLSKARHINKLSCLIVAGRDGCTVNVEHQRGQRRHIYVVYVPSHALCPWFGMSAMFRAMAVEVWWLLIHSLDFRGLGRGMFASQAPPHLFPPGFLCFTWVWNVLGYQSHAEGVPWKRQERP